MNGVNLTRTSRSNRVKVEIRVELDGADLDPASTDAARTVLDEIDEAATALQIQLNNLLLGWEPAVGRARAAHPSGGVRLPAETDQGGPVRSPAPLVTPPREVVPGGGGGSAGYGVGSVVPLRVTGSPRLTEANLLGFNAPADDASPPPDDDDNDDEGEGGAGVSAPVPSPPTPPSMPVNVEFTKKKFDADEVRARVLT